MRNASRDWERSRSIKWKKVPFLVNKLMGVLSINGKHANPGLIAERGTIDELNEMIEWMDKKFDYLFTTARSKYGYDTIYKVSTKPKVIYGNPGSTDSLRWCMGLRGLAATYERNSFVLNHDMISQVRDAIKSHGSFNEIKDKGDANRVIIKFKKEVAAQKPTATEDEIKAFIIQGLRSYGLSSSGLYNPLIVSKYDNTIFIAFDYDTSSYKLLDYSNTRGSLTRGYSREEIDTIDKIPDKYPELRAECMELQKQWDEIRLKQYEASKAWMRIHDEIIEMIR
jgi:hypothetical protein